MFLDGKNQYCENDYTTQSNLQIQCIPIKLPMAFFTELEQKNLKICMKGFPGGAVVESLPANAGDTGSSPGLGRSHMPRSN